MASKNAVPAVVTDEPKALSNYDYGADAGAGYEGTTASDYALPYLAVAQKGSPQVNPDKGAYIDGARAGMLFNTVTQELYDGKGEGVMFIPVHREHTIVKFTPRAQGGGFLGVIEPTSKEWLDAVERFKSVPRGSEQRKPASLDGKIEYNETFNVYGLIVKDNGQDWQPVVLGCAGAKRKPYKQWMTKARGIRIRQTDGRTIEPPLFAHVWRIKTVFQEGNGNDWYTINANFAGKDAAESRLAPHDPLFLAAKNFRDLVKSGT